MTKEGGREGGREGRREGGREGGRERERERVYHQKALGYMYNQFNFSSQIYTTTPHTHTYTHGITTNLLTPYMYIQNHRYYIQNLQNYTIKSRCAFSYKS